MWNQVVSQIHNPLSQMGIKYYLPLEDLKGESLASYYDIYPAKGNKSLNFCVVFYFVFVFSPLTKKENAVRSRGHNFSNQENEAH